MLKQDLDDVLVEDDLDEDQEDEDRLRVATNGDHLITPFQYDLF